MNAALSFLSMSLKIYGSDLVALLPYVCDISFKVTVQLNTSRCIYTQNKKLVEVGQSLSHLVTGQD